MSPYCIFGATFRTAYQIFRSLYQVSCLALPLFTWFLCDTFQLGKSLKTNRLMYMTDTPENFMFLNGKCFPNELVMFEKCIVAFENLFFMYGKVTRA